MPKKLRVGIIGCGGIATASHLPAYKNLTDQAEVVALCDVKKDVAEAAGAKFGVAKIYTDHQVMLKAEGLDAVTIATPNLDHYQGTLDALNAGVHVLCEKPLAMDGNQAKEMVQLAKAKNLVLQVGLLLRFGGPVQFAKAYTDAGHTGTVQYARAQALRRRGVPSWGVFIDKAKQGGGPLIDIGVHILDLTLYLMGYPKPISVSAQTWDTLGKDSAVFNGFGEYDRSKFTVEDMAVGFIRCEGGQTVVLESSFMANLEKDLFQTQLFGTQSGIYLNPNDPVNGVEIYTERDRQLFNSKPANIPKVADMQTEAIRSFIASIHGEAECKVPGYHGYVLNAIFDAMYASSATGKEVPVNLESI